MRHSRHGSAIRRRRLALQSPLLSETSDCGLPEMSLERAGSTSWTHRHIFEKRYSILVVTIVTFISRQATTIIAHEFVHSTTAWLLGYTPSPLSIGRSNPVTMTGWDEGAPYDQFFPTRASRTSTSGVRRCFVDWGTVHHPIRLREDCQRHRLGDCPPPDRVKEIGSILSGRTNRLIANGGGRTNGIS